MSSYGIVSEFNPFHNGHAYLFERAREQGAEAIVCVMSGNSVQRGELAIADKYARARAALDCGADLVLELPYPWSSASAEFFADAAVYIASFFSDTLLFGSELGNKEALLRAAKLCESDEFSAEYKKRLSEGEGAATAFLNMLSEKGFLELGSNDLLGISYIRAMLRNKYNMDFSTLKRQGADYNSTVAKPGELPSASAVRKMISEGDFNQAKSFLPESSARALRDAIENKELVDSSKMLDFALLFFRLNDPESFFDIAESGGGLSNRICSSAKDAKSGEELLELVKTKVYTNARIKRAMLYCMTGVKEDMMRARPEYTTLLAANEKGRELLAVNRKGNGIKVVTKPADAPRDSRQYILSERLDSIFTLASEKKMGTGELLKKGAYIIQNK